MDNSENGQTDPEPTQNAGGYRPRPYGLTASGQFRRVGYLDRSPNRKTKKEANEKKQFLDIAFNRIQRAKEAIRLILATTPAANI